MSTWTDEQKADVVKRYQAENPTPETSAEIVKQLAEEDNRAVNAVRMILTKAGVYIKKDATAAKTSTASGGGEKAPRVSKEAAHARLIDAIGDLGQKPDEEIIGKLTGKAAIYFAEVLEAVAKNTDAE